MDEFNEREVKKEKNVSVTWEESSKEEAVCAICDALFTPIENRPPIFCPDCKQGLAEILQL